MVLILLAGVRKPFTLEISDRGGTHFYGCVCSKTPRDTCQTLTQNPSSHSSLLLGQHQSTKTDFRLHEHQAKQWDTTFPFGDSFISTSDSLCSTYILGVGNSPQPPWWESEKVMHSSARPISPGSTDCPSLPSVGMWGRTEVTEGCRETSAVSLVIIERVTGPKCGHLLVLIICLPFWTPSFWAKKTVNVLFWVAHNHWKIFHGKRTAYPKAKKHEGPQFLTSKSIFLVCKDTETWVKSWG